MAHIQRMNYSFRPGEIEKIDETKAITGASSRTEVLSEFIRLGYHYVKYIEGGGKIYQEKNGKLQELLVISLLPISKLKGKRQPSSESS